MNDDQREYMVEIMRFSGHSFPSGACWGNAQMCILYDLAERLSYWEGVAVGYSGYPVHHGWLVIDGGSPSATIVEVTWRRVGEERPIIDPLESFRYDGQLIPREAVYRQSDQGSLHNHHSPRAVFAAWEGGSLGRA